MLLQVSFYGSIEGEFVIVSRDCDGFYQPVIITTYAVSAEDNALMNELDQLFEEIRGKKLSQKKEKNE